VTPYYSDDLVTIYHGDCREWMPEADVIVTDPPYGYRHASNRDDSAWRNEVIAGDEDTSARDDVLAKWGARPALVFGHWKVRQPVGTKAVLVWDKGLAAGMGDLAMPWKPNWEAIYVLGAGFEGRRDSGVIGGRGYNVVTWASKGRVHPNEKPVGLLRDLISKCPPGVVLDPFMGSGTTLRAAKDLGRRAIGIEIEERYCEIAATRCSQEVLGLAL
jgi:site-specific DNA-methyltransferase (adenine-specific)